MAKDSLGLEFISYIPSLKFENHCQKNNKRQPRAAAHPLIGQPKQCGFRPKK
jgi:hypothetical protein